MATQSDEEQQAILCYYEYCESGEFRLLEAATDHLIHLLEGPGPKEPETFGRLCFLLARCLQLRFERGKHPADIGNAIEYANHSLENFPSASDHDRCLLRTERSALLWQCLISQNDSLNCKDPDAAEKAFKLAEEIEKDLEHHGIQGQLRIESVRRRGKSYELRWDETGNPDDFRESIRLGQKVLSSVGEDCPLEIRSDALSDMAFRMQRAYGVSVELLASETGDSELPSRWEAASAAAVMLNESFELDERRPLKQIKNVMEFCSNIAVLPRQHRGAMLCAVFDLLKDCVSLLDDVIQTSLEFDLTEHASSADGLPRLAAAAALEKGESVHHAVCLLEKGRGLAKSALFDATSTRELQRRTEIPTELRAQYLEAWKALRAAVSTEMSFRHRKILLGKLRAAEAAVHSAMNTDRISDELSEQAISGLAVSYHIVIINMTSVRSDAILITKDGFRAVPLPDLDESEWIEPSFQIQYRLAQDREDLYHEAHNLLLDLLRRMWTCVVKPVLVSLQIHRQDGPLSTWPHICWIPTGVLSLYPMHAAGLGLHKKSNLVNYAISSYAPSLRSLIRRSRAMSHGSTSGLAPPSSPSAVALAMINTPGLPPEGLWENPEDAPERRNWPVLKYSREEVALVHRFFPLPDMAGIGTEFNPTTKEAITALEAGIPIVHLSCHGYINYMYPSNSIILFRDWEDDPLTVKVIDNLNIKSELVLLSACFTANSGVDNLQDESLQLTSSLFDAGFPRVVGSLWGVAQKQTRDFVEGFYEYLGTYHQGVITTRCVAEACHAATLQVGGRSRSDAETRGEPLYWAPFICVAA